MKRARHCWKAILPVKTPIDEGYGSRIVAEFTARQRAADSLLYNCAGFEWDSTISRYVISVRDHIVATVRTVAEVREFCMMHNGRLTKQD